MRRVLLALALSACGTSSRDLVALSKDYNEALRGLDRACVSDDDCSLRDIDLPCLVQPPIAIARSAEASLEALRMTWAARCGLSSLASDSFVTHTHAACVASRCEPRE